MHRTAAEPVPVILRELNRCQGLSEPQCQPLPRSAVLEATPMQSVPLQCTAAEAALQSLLAMPSAVGIASTVAAEARAAAPAAEATAAPPAAAEATAAPPAAEESMPAKETVTEPEPTAAGTLHYFALFVALTLFSVQQARLQME